MQLTNVTNWQQINTILKVDVPSNVKEGKCTICIPFHSLSEEFDVQFKSYVLNQLGVENEL